MKVNIDTLEIEQYLLNDETIFAATFSMDRKNIFIGGQNQKIMLINYDIFIIDRILF